MPVARCRLCNVALMARDEPSLMVLMMSHVMQEHYRDEKYGSLFKELAKLMKGDFIMEEE